MINAGLTASVTLDVVKKQALYFPLNHIGINPYKIHTIFKL